MNNNCKFVSLNEASLGRVYQHVTGEKNVTKWGMITAYRYANTPAENKALNKKLESDLRSLGYGFFKVEGHWVECQDANKSYQDCPKDQLHDVAEESLFVPDITSAHIHKLGNKYGQDAVIYGDAKKVILIFKDSNVESIGKFSPGKIQQAYSKLKDGKTFVFESTKKKILENRNKLIDLLSNHF